MTFLCRCDDLTDPGSLGVEDHGVFVVKRDGQYFAYRNNCPHLGVELNWLEHQFLDSDDALIQCATHGALFVIENGECVAGPCLGDALEPVAICERDGELHLVDNG